MKTATERKTIIRPDETMPEHDIEGAVAAHSDAQAFQNDSPKFHEDILQQYATPFHTDGWLHSGLND